MGQPVADNATEVRNEPVRPRGAALVLALVAFVVVAILSLALCTLVRARVQDTDSLSDGLQAVYLAQSGIAAALQELRANKKLFAAPPAMLPQIPNPTTPGNVAETWFADPSGETLSYVCYYRDIDASTCLLHSEGTVNRRGITALRVWEVVLSKPTAVGSFWAGMSGLDWVLVKGTPRTDSYDSSKTLPAAQALHHGDVTSNGDITAQGAAYIDGNANPGVGKSVLGGGTVTGSTTPRTDVLSISLPAYTSLPGLPAGYATAINKNTGAALSTPGNYRYSALSLGSKAVLSFADSATPVTYNIFVDGTIDMSGQAMIVVGTNVKVNLYQGPGTAGSPSTLSLTGGGQISAATGTIKKDASGNNVGIPGNFNLVTTTTGTVSLLGGTDFVGTLVAPYAAVDCGGTSGYYGAILGKNVTYHGTADFHYDVNVKSPYLARTTYEITGSRDPVRGN